MKTAFENIGGIHVSAEARKKFAAFESRYNHLREQEGRIFTTEELKALPTTPPDHPYHTEWEIRRATIEKFLMYLSDKKASLHVLDVGCGTGFFSRLMARQGHQVTAVDVSLYELEQAAQAFGSMNPTWHYADVMTENLPGGPFDVITLQASIQYFERGAELIKHLMGSLKKGGEIHIMDSPFYKDESSAEAARQRSLNHFRSLGATDMAPYYHFHTWEVIKTFSHKVRTKGKTLMARLLRQRTSPFPWIIIKKS